jgi:GNAT superfamily N-acetyltransferase
MPCCPRIFLRRNKRSPLVPRRSLKVIGGREIDSAGKKTRIKMPEIFEVTEITDEILEAFQRLIAQLTSSRRAPNREELRSLARSPSTTLLIARDDGKDRRIIGTLSLVLYPLPTGLRARIEDVITDSSARRKGVGELLVTTALERAAKSGAWVVDLTSTPRREAAHRLYLRLGFKRWETYPYRYLIEE